MLVDWRLPKDGVLQRAVKSCERLILWAAAFSALINLLYLTPTIYMMQVYDRALPAGGRGTLIVLSFAAIGGLLTLSVLDWVRSRLLVRISARLDHALAGPVLGAVLSGRADAKGRGTALRDLDSVRQSLAGPALLALLDAPWSPIFLIVGFMVHWSLGLMGLISSIILIGLALLNERAVRAPIEAAGRAAAVGYAELEHASAKADSVRALGLRHGLVFRHIQYRRQILTLQNRASFAAGVYLGLIKGARLMLQSLALGLGAWLAIDRAISPGAVFAASFLIARMLAPVEQLVGAWRTLVVNRSAWANLSSLLMEPERPTPTRLPHPRGALVVEGVDLLAPTSGRQVLHNVSLEAKPGEIVGVVGPSGAGKTSLLRVIANATTSERGSVRLDDAAYGDWAPDQLAQHIGYLPQDFVLFAGTVKENIARFRVHDVEPGEALDRMAVEAALAAGAHEMILHLPNGYDTALHIGGAGLSAGQAQRIGLARALFGNPCLIVLDEPNAHLDAAGEEALCNTLAALRAGGRTIVFSAHRGALLKLADKILVLESGRIARVAPRPDAAVEPAAAAVGRALRGSVAFEGVRSRTSA